jgi:hypothetical protein
MDIKQEELDKALAQTVVSTLKGKSGKLEVATLLLKNGANANTEYSGENMFYHQIMSIDLHCYAFFYAAAPYEKNRLLRLIENDFNLLRILIEYGADKKVRYEGQSPSAYFKSEIKKYEEKIGAEEVIAYLHKVIALLRT